jgi:hypothetical protein
MVQAKPRFGAVNSITESRPPQHEGWDRLIGIEGLPIGTPRTVVEGVDGHVDGLFVQ